MSTKKPTVRTTSRAQRESGLPPVFFAQWENEIKNDWTIQVKDDMNDFCLPIGFDWMKSKSEDSFKKLVKVKAYEYALYIFNSMKGSKMRNKFMVN